MVNVKRTHKKKRHYNRGKRINRAHNAMSGGVDGKDIAIGVVASPFFLPAVGVAAVAGAGALTGAVGYGSYLAGKQTYKAGKLLGKGIAESKFGTGAKSLGKGIAESRFGRGAKRFGKFITTRNNGTKRKIGFRLGSRKSKQTGGSRKRLNKRNKRSKKISKRF